MFIPPQPQVTQVSADRQKTHGNFRDSAVLTQRLKATIWGFMPSSKAEGCFRLKETQKEALDMIAFKIARILSGDPNHKDHWDDIAGYATLISQELTPGG